MDGVSGFSTTVSLNTEKETGDTIRIHGQSKRLFACQSFYVLEFSVSRSSDISLEGGVFSGLKKIIIV